MALTDTALKALKPKDKTYRVCGTQPILGAMDSMAAHSEGYSPRCSRTMRTARSRTSGENWFDFLLMAQSSQRNKPPQIPGRFMAPVFRASPHVTYAALETVLGETDAGLTGHVLHDTDVAILCSRCEDPADGVTIDCAEVAREAELT